MLRTRSRRRWPAWTGCVSREDGFSPPECSPPDSHHGRHASPRPDRLPTESSWKAGRDEFRELADAFDTMLARLEAHVAEQQRFASQRLPRAAHHADTLDVARNDPSRSAIQPSGLLGDCQATRCATVSHTTALSSDSRRPPMSSTIRVASADAIWAFWGPKLGVTA